jgi:hypothetical protein
MNDIKRANLEQQIADDAMALPQKCRQEVLMLIHKWGTKISEHADGSRIMLSALSMKQLNILSRYIASRLEYVQLMSESMI